MYAVFINTGRHTGCVLLRLKIMSRTWAAGLDDQYLLGAIS